MKTINNIFGIIIICFFHSNLHCQTHINGFIKDMISEEVIVGAHIIEKGSSNIVVSDNNGYFSISIIDSSLEVSYMGYQSMEQHFNCSNDTMITIYLSPGEEIEEIVVKAPKTNKINVASLNNNELNTIPSLGAKPDVLKTLQLLSGIQNQTEGSSLILVRGGSPGQNLYLIDNIPLIYVNHLGGFLSVFNPDMINKVNVYKAAFPARYGGKLSSIVDITQREGNNKNTKASLGIGITDISFSFEGPIKDNSSLMLTGRKTLTESLLYLASSLSDAGQFKMIYGFHDINGKFTYRPNNSNSFHFNLYQGDDYLNFWSKNESNLEIEKSNFGNKWGNWLLSSTWKRIISPKFFMTNSLSFTRYRLKNTQAYSLSGGVNDFNYKNKYLSSLQDISWRSEWKYEIFKNWKINYGLHSSYLYNVPSKTYQSVLEEQAPTLSINSTSSAIFIDNSINLFGKTRLNIGVRGCNYITKNWIDFKFEPRASLNIALPKSNFIDLSYMSVSQYSHLVFTSADIYNNEVWISSDNSIPASNSEQYTLGWNNTFYRNMYYSEINFYYKEMTDLITYKEGYNNLQGDNNWKSKIEKGGIGTSKGAEFLLRKNYGNWTGFISYSYSNSTRQFQSINNGNKYLYEYDRPHSGSISISRKISSNLVFNIAWIYQTGLPYTPAIGRQIVPGLSPNENGEEFYYEALIYGERNQARMKDYHRMDIALHYTRPTKKNKLKSIWSLSIYNLYNRHNPYYYYFNTNNTGEIYVPENGGNYQPVSLYQISFFPIIPTIAYKVYFDSEYFNNIHIKDPINNWLYPKK